MDMTSIILIFGIIGLAASLLIKYSKFVQGYLRIEHAKNKKYIYGKMNLLMVLSIILILYAVMEMTNPAVKGKYDLILSSILLLVILIDMIVQRKVKLSTNDNVSTSKSTSKSTSISSSKSSSKINTKSSTKSKYDKYFK
ncbi:MAG: hypothetical protein AB9844_09495 [Clostridiaceae bacterium]